MTDENAIPMRRREREVAEVNYAPRPRRMSDKAAESAQYVIDLETRVEQIEQERKAEVEQLTLERDRFSNALHASELRNVDLVAQVKKLENDIDVLRISTDETAAKLRECISVMATRLSSGAEQFLAALRVASEYSRPVSMSTEMHALAAVEAALPEEPTP
jgi:sialic acid synthase SpsE